jgi:glycosyltransferase involved in cell wall biosynthesis
VGIVRASIVIRTLNESQHLADLFSLINRQITNGIEIETVLIDSGSTDGTVEIATHFGARVALLHKSHEGFIS